MSVPFAEVTFLLLFCEASVNKVVSSDVVRAPTHPQVTKRIYKDCHDRVMNDHIQTNNPTCFDACHQPHNTTSTCWIQCVGAAPVSCCPLILLHLRIVLFPPGKIIDKLLFTTRQQNPAPGASMTPSWARGAMLAPSSLGRDCRPRRLSTTLASPFSLTTQKRAAARIFKRLCVVKRRSQLVDYYYSVIRVSRCLGQVLACHRHPARMFS